MVDALSLLPVLGAKTKANDVRKGISIGFTRRAARLLLPYVGLDSEDRRCLLAYQMKPSSVAFSSLGTRSRSGCTHAQTYAMRRMILR